MVLLSEIAEALTTTDGFDWYYDRADDKVLMMATYDSLPEDDELQDAIEEDTTGRYIRIDDFEGSNRGWDCMARFAASKDGDVRYRLERAINRRGAFRMFKDTVEDLGLLDEWRRFEEDDELRRAMDWCEKNGISYTEQSLQPLSRRRQAAGMRTRPRAGPRRTAHARYLLKNASILSNGMASFPPPSYRSV